MKRFFILLINLFGYIIYKFYKHKYFRSIAKKKFGENSSIKIKEYLLDKNEKKLKKGRSFLI